MATDKTNNFGFKKVPSGHMVYGKDLNDVLEDIDEKLGESLGAMSEGASGAAMEFGNAAWTALDDGTNPFPEIIFGSQMSLKRARFVVTNGLLAGNSSDLAIARAGTTTPLTTSFTVTGTGGEGVVTALAETIIDADEELIVIEKDSADTGYGPLTADVQVVIEGNRVTA